MAKNKNFGHPVLSRFIRIRTAAHLRKTQGMTFLEARETADNLTDDVLDNVVARVAKEKGVAVPEDVGAEGDHPFIDFLNAHWDDILRIIMMLLGGL